MTLPAADAMQTTPPAEQSQGKSAAARRYECRFVVAGTGVAVHTNDGGIAGAIHARLKSIQAATAQDIDIVFEISVVSEPQSHVVGKPKGKGRPVYDPPAGEVLYLEDRDQLYIDFDGRVRVLTDLAGGLARVSALQSEAGNLWLVSHPLFTLPLLELLKRRERYSLHAGGLCVNGRGLLLPGASGAGKSTLTLALLRSGFGFMSDDTVFLSQHQDGLRVFAFPEDIDITDKTAVMFPELDREEERTRIAGAVKWQISAPAVYGVDYVPACSPTVLVFPEVANRPRSVLEPLDPGAALLELVPNVLLTDPESSQQHLNILGRLVETCDCYRLRTGTDLEAVPELLRSVIP